MKKIIGIKGATEAMQLLIKYSFNHLNINEIRLGVDKKNLGDVKSYKKSHFKVYNETESVYRSEVVRKR